MIRAAAPMRTWIRSAAFLACADYGILDFSLIISPSTANLPFP